jgi:predicted RNase H-related nuclease YkuK (DUF458 family)
VSDTFYSPSKGKLNLEAVIDEIAGFLTSDPEGSYYLVVGTDSHKNGKPHAADFVTAIVVHRQGRGGRYFWTRRSEENIYTLREKIYRETLLSLDLAGTLVPKLHSRLDPLEHAYQLEIHIDVGQNGPTREMIREVVGMVVGNGYTAKTKPEAYGAFVVADRHA